MRTRSEAIHPAAFLHLIPYTLVAMAWLVRIAMTPANNGVDLFLWLFSGFSAVASLVLAYRIPLLAWLCSLAISACSVAAMFGWSLMAAIAPAMWCWCAIAFTLERPEREMPRPIIWGVMLMTLFLTVGALTQLALRGGPFFDDVVRLREGRLHRVEIQYADRSTRVIDDPELLREFASTLHETYVSFRNHESWKRDLRIRLYDENFRTFRTLDAQLGNRANPAALWIGEGLPEYQNLATYAWLREHGMLTSANP